MSPRIVTTRRARAARTAAVLFSVSAFAHAAVADTHSWVGSNGGSWNSAASWWNGTANVVPAAGDTANITLSPTAAYAVTYNGSYTPGAGALGALNLNSATPYPVTLYQTAGNNLYVTNTEFVGVSGPATHIQSAGINSPFGLYLGQFNGSTGTYSLSGTGTLAATDERVGYYGLGTFAQSGGSNSASVLVVGYYPNANASYSLTAGTLSVSGAETVSFDDNSCTFNQSGTASSNSAVTLALASWSSASKGTYNLSAGTLSTTSHEYVGESGTGTFSHSGGTNTVGSNLYIGNGSLSTGIYNLSSAGTLRVSGNLTVNAHSQFNWTGGSFDWAPGHTLDLTGGGKALWGTNSYDFPTSSTVNISGAGSALSANLLDVGHGATVNISAGGAFSAGGSTVIGTAGDGAVSVDGAGSTFYSNYDGFIGYGGNTGSLDLRHGAAGAVVGALQLASGTTPNTTGHVNVESGSTFTAMNAVYVGHDATGNQFGDIEVTGPGSTFTQSDTSYYIHLGSDSTEAYVSGQIAVSLGASFTGGHLNLYRTGSLSVQEASASFVDLTILGGRLWFYSGSLSTGGNFLVGPERGSMSLLPQHNLTVGGTTSIFSGYYLHLDGGTFSTGSILEFGDFTFNGGVLSITGASGLSFSSAGSVLGPNPVLTSAQTLNVTNLTTILSSATLVVDGGRLNATGNLTNSGELALLSDASRITGTTLTNNGLLRGNGRIDNNLVNASGAETRAAAADTLRFRGSSNSNAGRISLLGGTADFSGSLTNSASGVISGHGTLYASTLTNNGQIQLSGGATDVFAALTNNSGSKVIVSGGSTATFYKSVTNNAGSEFRVSAGSSAVFFAPLSGVGLVTGLGTKYYEAGASATSFLATGGTTVVESPASLTTAYLREGSLVAAGPVALSPSSASVLNSLTIQGAGSFDLSNDSLILDYTGSSPVEQLRTYLQTGALFSSTAAADPLHRQAIAYAEASQVGLSSWAGLPVDSTALVTRFTWYGDANLSGAVDRDDFALIDRGFARHLTGWTAGDFNYDGAVTVADYLLIDRVFIQQSGPLSPDLLAQRESQFGPAYVSALLASVPEPSLLILALGVPFLTRRRRRNAMRGGREGQE